jgi:hypothetical protein
MVELQSGTCYFPAPIIPAWEARPNDVSDPLQRTTSGNSNNEATRTRTLRDKRTPRAEISPAPLPLYGRGCQIGVRGFEPPTSASRTQRSNQAELHSEHPRRRAARDSAVYQPRAFRQPLRRRRSRRNSRLPTRRGCGARVRATSIGSWTYVVIAGWRTPLPAGAGSSLRDRAAGARPSRYTGTSVANARSSPVVGGRKRGTRTEQVMKRSRSHAPDARRPRCASSPRCASTAAKCHQRVEVG